MTWKAFMFLLLAVGFLVHSGSLRAADAPLSLTVSDSNPIYANGQGDGLVDRLAVEAFSRLGHAIVIQPLPSERAIRNAEIGLDDGDLLRIGGLSKSYPNLIQVPEKWIDMVFVAFTNRPEVVVRDWESLKPYSVGIIKGWRVFEGRTQEVAFRSRVRNAVHLFQLLDAGRADVILYDRLQGRYFIQKLGLKDVRSLEPPLTTNAIYLYLNKKHADLVPRVAEALRAMKRDGAYDRIVGAHAAH